MKKPALFVLALIVVLSLFAMPWHETRIVHPTSMSGIDWRLKENKIDTQLVNGDSISGQGVYIVVDYTLYPDESRSSLAVWILNLNDGFSYKTLAGENKWTTYGDMGLSLIPQKLGDVEYGFRAWGVYNSVEAAAEDVPLIVAAYQKALPKAYVVGYTCPNAYFEAGSSLQVDGWCD